MKRFTIITVLMLLAGAVLLPVAVSAAKPAAAKSNMGQLRKVKQRMLRYYEGGKPSDAAVEEILSRMEADGSFSNIDYTDEAFNTGGKKTPHLIDLAKLARAYATTPGTHYKSRELYDAIARSLGYWFDLDLKDQNWWHRIIGWPKNLIPTLVLMGDDMKRYDKELYARFIDYMTYSWSIPKQRAQDGANGTDISQVTFTAAVFSENPELLGEVIDKVNSLIKIAEGDREEGIQGDFSFTQHNGSGRQLYLATYGRDYVSGIIFFMNFVNGTDFWLAPEKVDIFERLFLDGLAWTWYDGEIDVNQYGRGLLRSSTAPSYLELAQQLAAFGTPRSEELKRMIAFMKGGEELNGNRMYPRADYMIHRPKGAMISTRMTSTRTVGNEAGNSEGMLNYHTGDGANYVKVHGDEYNPIYAGWNWKRIPGTTVMADDREMPAPMWGEKGQGGSDYAGGASDGTDGLCAFVYAKDDLTAHKGWFYFDRYYVALGAGIASERSDAPAVTTVNQTRLAGKVLAGSGGGLAELGTAPFDRLWHYDTGYRFEPGTTAAAAVVRGDYPEGYKGKKSDILLLTVDHGTAPQGGSYAYAVYPAVSQEAFAAAGGEYRILSNTAAVQAVQDVATGKTMVAFYEPGRVEAEGFGTVAADQPCLLIVGKSDDGTKVYVASPFCENHAADPVTVTVGEKQATVAFDWQTTSATL